MMFILLMFFFFKQKTAYEMRISDWSSDVCSSDLALKNCSPRAAVAIKHAIELDEEATRNFVVTNENPTAAACEQFLATLQGGPDEESAQAGAAKPNDDS